MRQFVELRLRLDQRLVTQFSERRDPARCNIAVAEQVEACAAETLNRQRTDAAFALVLTVPGGRTEIGTLVEIEGDRLAVDQEIAAVGEHPDGATVALEHPDVQKLGQPVDRLVAPVGDIGKSQLIVEPGVDLGIELGDFLQSEIGFGDRVVETDLGLLAHRLNVVRQPVELVRQGRRVIDRTVPGGEGIGRRGELLQGIVETAEDRVERVGLSRPAEHGVDPVEKLRAGIDLRADRHFRAQLLLQESVDIALDVAERDTGRDAARQLGDRQLHLARIARRVRIGDVARRKVDRRIGDAQAGQGNA